jgi:hypothetical protein
MTALLRSVLPSVLAAAVGLSAGEPAVQAILPDAGRSLARLAEGPWAAAWQHTGASAWRAAAEPTEAAWLAGWSGAGQMRLVIAAPRRHGGVPVLAGQIAAVSRGTVASVAQPLEQRRDGAWVIATMPPSADPLPELPQLSEPAADLGAIISLGAAAGFLDDVPARVVRALLAGCRMDRLEVGVDLAAASEVVRLPRAALPLRAIDPATLNGLPAGLDAYLVAGLDGAGLAAQIPALLTASGPEPAWQRVCLERLGVEPAVLAGWLDGTAVIGWSGDGRIVIALPFAEAGQPALQRWIETAHPEPDESVTAKAVADLAAAAEQPVGVAGPTRGAWFARRTANRLWLATHAELLAAIVPDASPAPLEEMGGPAEGALLMAGWRDGAMGRLVAAALPATGRLGGLARLCAQAPTPPGTLVLRASEDGVRAEGRHAAAVLLPLGAAVLAAAPALVAERTADASALATARMRHVLGRCRAFASAHAGAWPRGIDDLRSWSEDVADGDLEAPGRPDIALPYRFVPPAADPPADQPVLIRAPEDGAVLVGFADGRVERRRGTELWELAGRLISDPAASTTGIPAESWPGMPKSF